MNQQAQVRATHPQSKRKRSRRACEPCRKRKKKCDGRDPCQLCSDFEYDCRYDDLESGDRSAYLKKRLNSIPSTAATVYGINEPNATSEQHTDQASDTMDASSVLTFPNILASSLASGGQQREKSLIYTLGLREGSQMIQGPTLKQMILLEDILKYSRVYFSTVHVWHDYLVQDEFESHTVAYWQSPSLSEPAFEMLTAFLVALGSFFSWPTRFDKEEQIVTHAVSWMNANTLPDASTHLNMFLAAAYIERTVYYRATASPRMAWMASCSAVHMAESMGLHREPSTVSSVTSREKPSQKDIDHQRRLFWLAKNINAMISAEYGRSRVHIAGITCLPIERRPDEPAQILNELGSTLPEDSYPTNDLLIQACIESVEKLSQTPGRYAYVQLVRGEMACLAYRRLVSAGVKVVDPTKHQILTLGQQAMDAAIELVNSHTPWWKVNQTPFQFLCTLLSIDEPNSLSLVPRVMNTISRVHDVFGTNRTKNAQDNAQLLIRFALQKKEREMNSLKQALAVMNESSDTSTMAGFEDLYIAWADVMNGELWGIDIGI